MYAPEALRSIRYDLLSYIQERVQVDFDNVSRLPLHFFYRTQRYTVREVFGHFRVREDSFANGFLLRANDEEIYFLYFHEFMPGHAFSQGCWVLSFRVLSDRELMTLYREERQMLVNMTVKRVVDFHGHLCPELVIGIKACEYSLQLLFRGEQPTGQISVVAENCTSALDAFQVLLGVTMGNQALKVFDFGKHNYTFSRKNSSDGFTLRLRSHRYYNEHEYAVLEEKILKNETTLDEVVQFQQILDDRVSELLAYRPEDLFDVEVGCRSFLSSERPTVYVSCSRCGQEVLMERAVAFQRKVYCRPCFQLIKSPTMGHSLH
jgi:formylmethanofuran dehydrogenase subunit E